jgi:hypothetical protein
MSRFLAFKQRAVPQAEESDPLLSFSAEAELASPPAGKSLALGQRSLSYQSALAGLLFLAIFALGVLSAVYLRPSSRTVPAQTRGTATIASEPSGAGLFVDGVSKGLTPIELELEAGEHSIEIRGASSSRTLKLTIAAGERTTHHVELPVSASPAAAMGRLEVTSDPPGARVTVDNTARGVTPLTIGNLSPGAHRVVVSNGTNSLQRTVQMEEGGTATVAVSLAPSQAAGWISFSAPFEMHVFDRGELVGTTVAQRLMLPAGRRDVELVSQAYGFRHVANVDVPAGKTTTLHVPVPNGSLSINALPWAEVWVDGRSAGTTPLANLTVAIGPHEVVWRHPRHGERRQTVPVTAQAPARIGVDFTK